MSVTTIGALNGAKISFIAATGRCERTPMTMRSGSIKSPTANPSRKNSGLLTTSKSTFAVQYRLMVSATFSPVLTGTVLLSTTILYSVMAAAMSRATFSMKLKSTEPSGCGGVGTAMKITPDFRTPSAVLFVNSRRPAAIFFSQALRGRARKSGCRRIEAV